MKKVLYGFAFASLLLAVGGCKKSFFDINENPNSPTEASITPNLIFPRAVTATAGRMATSYGNYAGWMGYWARSGTYGPSTEEESYNITTTFEADEWSGWYDILSDFDVMEKKANASEQTFYEGMAKAMKTIGFMYLVDQYNNVPYSKAFDLSGNILPAYDKGEDIYKDLFVQLDNAQALITNAVSSANPGLAASDILFGGDPVMWRKFINTMRLKLLIRLSQTGVNAGTEIAKIDADGSGYLGAGETGFVQPGFSSASSTKQNPFWNSYSQLFNGDNADQYNRANNYVLNLFGDNNDVRYTDFFQPVATACAACVPAVPAGSYYGYNYGEVVNEPNQPKQANSSKVSGPGLVTAATDPIWLMTSVESLFLQAEATQRGWIPGDAKTAYRAAVTESFVWLGEDEETATEYLDQTAPIVSWDAATTADAKIKLIATQKYLALVGINNFEAYVDYRRLGVPTTLPLSLSPSRGTNKIPLRILYPQDEYNYNAAAVKAEGTIDAQTSTIFWDK